MIKKSQNKTSKKGSCLDIRFKNSQLLKRALTHRSYLNEHKEKGLESNERMEFLGDAILEFWATEQLFNLFPQLPEGVLTNIRASLVCTESLANIAKKIKIGESLLLSKGEDEGGGRCNPSLLADTFEAIIGAIWLDQGWLKVNQFLEKNLLSRLISLGKLGDNKDAKTKLQEEVQAMIKITPYYQVIKEEGPDHNKKFTVAVHFGEKEIAQGKGDSKREAEEDAANQALTILGKKSKIKPIG